MTNDFDNGTHRWRARSTRQDRWLLVQALLGLLLVVAIYTAAVAYTTLIMRWVWYG